MDLLLTLLHLLNNKRCSKTKRYLRKRTFIQASYQSNGKMTRDTGFIQASYQSHGEMTRDTRDTGSGS